MMGAKAERKPRNLARLVHDSGGTNRKGAPFLLRDKRGVVVDQANGCTQGFMLIVLLLEGVP
jgi:hypothetical protein